MTLQRKDGSALALALAGALALGCVALVLVSTLQVREAAELRRAAPPPIYTEPRPQLEPALAPLPQPVFFSDAQAEDESEWLQ